MSLECMHRARYGAEYGMNPDLSYELARLSFEEAIRLNPGLAGPRNDPGRILSVRAWYEHRFGGTTRDRSQRFLRRFSGKRSCRVEGARPTPSLPRNYVRGWVTSVRCAAEGVISVLRAPINVGPQGVEIEPQAITAR